MKKQSGFSLIELMIALIILAILAILGYSSYRDKIQKARRADAIQTLIAMQLAEENYRSNNTSYGTIAQVWSGVTTTPNGLYNLSISNVSATSYTVTAAATGSQSTDKENGTACTPLSITVSSGTETKLPINCWIK